MRKSMMTATVAAVVFTGGALPAFATDTDVLREAVTAVAAAEGDPVDPVNPAPPTNTDTNPTPTPGVPETEGGGSDPVNPIQPPVVSEPEPIQPDTPSDAPADTPAEDGADTDAPSGSEAEEVAPSVPEISVDPGTVTDVAEGTFTPGESAPEGHAFVETASDGSFTIVDSYRPGVQLAKTGADHIIAALAGAAAIASAGGASVFVARRKA